MPPLLVSEFTEAFRFTRAPAIRGLKMEYPMPARTPHFISSVHPDKSLLDELAEIDAALTGGEATPEQEERGQALVTLADAAPRMLSALLTARELFYTLGDRDTQESKDCFQLFEMCDEAIAHAAPGSNWNPIDVDGNNEDRARWAKAALKAFMDQTGVDYKDALGDLLCDLMHLSDREPFDFQAALDRARGHYAAETRAAL